VNPLIIHHLESSIETFFAETGTAAKDYRFAVFHQRMQNFRKSWQRIWFYQRAVSNRTLVADDRQFVFRAVLLGAFSDSGYCGTGV
jgi:3-hydroxy-3-methylglutaryl CoA synthase